MSARQRRKRAKRRRHAPGRPGTRHRIIAGAGLGVAAALGAGTTAHAADFTVNAGDDAGDGTCDAAPGGCTLRDALDDAAANDNSPTVDQILFDSSVTGTITLNGTQLPTIDEPLYIDGPGAGTLEVSGNDASRILLIRTGAADVTVSGLTLSAGNASGYDGTAGGAILNDGAHLTIDQVTITGNTAAGLGGGLGSGPSGTTEVESSTISGNSASWGGGVSSSTVMTVTDSTISGNTAHSGGGGVYALSAPMTVKDSTISGNKANSGYGGGLLAGSGATTLQTSTVSGNSSMRGGGLSVGVPTKYGGRAVTEIRDSTIAGNSASGVGGGILAQLQGRNPTVANTIVADNSAGGTGPDLFTPSGASGETFEVAFSLIENPAAPISDAVPGSIIAGVDPQLGPLADNGGPTATQALPETSAAVDQGSSELNSDQRGMLRAVNPSAPGDSEVFGANCADIGAFELQLPDGGMGPACHSDLSPPETEITDAPADRRHKKTATFAFTSTEPGSSFDCKLDDGPFEPCSSPDEVQVKGKGKHSFEVRAVDAAGNVDPTPAVDDWKVTKRKAKKR